MAQRPLAQVRVQQQVLAQQHALRTQLEIVRQQAALWSPTQPFGSPEGIEEATLLARP